MENLVSVIISSYNRYDSLKNSVNSIQNQTHKDIEIIIIDDGSEQIEYNNLTMNNLNIIHYNVKCSKEPISRSHSFLLPNSFYNNIEFIKTSHENIISNIYMIHLDKLNSRIFLGYPSCGYVRNFGFNLSKGKFIAILDDDDVFLPKKLERQLGILKNHNYLMCCSEAYLTKKNDKAGKLYLYNKGYWQNALRKVLETNTFNDYDNIIDNNLINKHNVVICSSVLFKRQVFELIGYMATVPNWRGYDGIYQDWDYWKKIVKHSNIYYIQEPLLIYYL